MAPPESVPPSMAPPELAPPELVPPNSANYKAAPHDMGIHGTSPALGASYDRESQAVPIANKADLFTAPPELETPEEGFRDYATFDPVNTVAIGTETAPPVEVPEAQGSSQNVAQETRSLDVIEQDVELQAPKTPVTETPKTVADLFEAPVDEPATAEAGDGELHAIGTLETVKLPPVVPSTATSDSELHIMGTLFMGPPAQAGPPVAVAPKPVPPIAKTGEEQIITAEDSAKGPPVLWPPKPRTPVATQQEGSSPAEVRQPSLSSFSASHTGAW